MDLFSILILIAATLFCIPPGIKIYLLKKEMKKSHIVWEYTQDMWDKLDAYETLTPLQKHAYLSKILKIQEADLERRRNSTLPDKPFWKWRKTPINPRLWRLATSEEKRSEMTLLEQIEYIAGSFSSSEYN